MMRRASLKKRGGAHFPRPMRQGALGGLFDLSAGSRKIKSRARPFGQTLDSPEISVDGTWGVGLID